MVQPSPHLLLRPAATLAANFNIFAHPKVPLTPNESKQLLKALTTSFRRQLAEEHDIRTLNPTQNGSASTATTPSSSSPKKRPARPNVTSTDRHLHDVLSNPLLSFQPPSTRTGPRDPMDVFDEACARGIMDIARARACLHSKRVSLGESLEEQPAGMETSGAGSKVLQWLLSTGAESNSSWVQQNGTGFAWAWKDIIFDFLVLEGKQEALWELFEGYAAQKVSNTREILFQLSRSLAHHISTDAGLESVVRANEILIKAETPFNARIRILYPAISLLVNHTKVNTPENVQRSPELFNRFLSIVQTFPKRSAISKPELFVPQLHLCHPTNPDARHALRYLKNLNEAPPEDLLQATKVLSNSLSSLALDTAKQLIANEQFDDARWVLGFVQKAYPELNQGDAQPQPKPTQSARAMELLGFVKQRYSELKSPPVKMKKAGARRLSQSGKTTSVQEEDDIASLEELRRLDLGLTNS
ncbi:hypothetical protein V496_03462 [Pseudogymnoascus sp. VKM F-4515 (FW-2607)]|nr:hypothetical protein V496_03462 [Pseudogymnoascus sp. VKM F-4515 (FW-2607)]KFY86066.1 hypothetical protein V498_07607 [Pseudogymnoascus sp. VKM F-4517 (FW-2822)]